MGHLLKDEIPSSELSIERVIGRGSAGEVLRGKWNETVIALKPMHLTKPARLAKELDVWRYLTSCLGSSNQTHDSIVQFLGICRKQEDLYLVMEYAPFGNLLEYCQQHKLSTRTRLDALYKVGSPLTQLDHERAGLSPREGCHTW